MYKAPYICEPWACLHEQVQLLYELYVTFHNMNSTFLFISLFFTSHLFHKMCVEPWLLEHHTCPMCKYDILRREVQHIYIDIIVP